MIQMTLQLAETALRAAQEKAKALGTAMTVTVVDEAGRPIGVLNVHDCLRAGAA